MKEFIKLWAKNYVYAYVPRLLFFILLVLSMFRLNPLDYINFSSSIVDIYQNTIRSIFPTRSDVSDFLYTLGENLPQLLNTLVYLILTAILALILAKYLKYRVKDAIIKSAVFLITIIIITELLQRILMSNLLFEFAISNIYDNYLKSLVFHLSIELAIVTFITMSLTKYGILQVKDLKKFGLKPKNNKPNK